LARYCGATPHIQSETRRELSVAVANCVRCNPMRNALVRTQQRKDDTELFVRIENCFCRKKALPFSEEEKKNNDERKEERERENVPRDGKQIRRERKGTREHSCNQSDSLSAICAIHRSSSEHVRNCMLALP